MARCDRMTGKAVEAASRGDIVFIRGFLYRRKRPRARFPWLGARRIARLERETLDILEHSSPGHPRGPAALADLLETTLSHLSKLYDASQARWRPARSSSSLDMGAMRFEMGQELAVKGARSPAPAELVAASPRLRDTRAHLHDLIVLTLSALGNIVEEAAPDPDLRARIGFNGLRERGILHPRPVEYDRKPLTEPRPQATIVAGAIRGRVWPAAADHPPEGPGPWILAGEEIGSSWVRHLHLFDGIVSVYGHPSSHLGLSARSLGLPYRTVAPDRFARFLRRNAKTDIPSPGQGA